MAKCPGQEIEVGFVDSIGNSRVKLKLKYLLKMGGKRASLVVTGSGDLSDISSS